MPGLDILRGIAILLVLGHHHYYAHYWHLVGWSGVQLFFVLSGFLVSGLLFKELQQTGRINFPRFFFRRGMRIYPAFYAFLLITLPYYYRFSPFEPAKLFSEVFFLQSYLPAVHGVTWTLAIEEHFYLILPFTLGALWSRVADPRKQCAALVNGTAALLLLCVSVRLATVALHPEFDFFLQVKNTHLHFDAFACGVLLSYLWTYHRAAFCAAVSRHRLLLIVVAGVLVAPCAFRERRDHSLLTIGLSSLNLGFALWIAVSVVPFTVRPASLRPWALLGVPVAFIGRMSYGIYLWHLPMEQWGMLKVRQVLGAHSSPLLLFAIYLLGSVLLGAASTYAIEQPVLRLRDRIWRGA